MVFKFLMKSAYDSHSGIRYLCGVAHSDQCTKYNNSNDSNNMAYIYLLY